MIKTIRFEGYKSFASEVDLEIDANVIVLIGRNNSGKSSVLDIVNAVYSYDYQRKFEKDYKKLAVSFIVDDKHISKGFRGDIFGGTIPGNHYVYAKKFIDTEQFFEIEKPSGLGGNNCRVLSFYTRSGNRDIDSNWDNVASSYGSFDKDYIFLRIDAERNIVPEPEEISAKVKGNGDGATNIIRKYILSSKYDENLVQVKLLDALNTIMEPDCHFSSIRIQQNEGTNLWEVYLIERDKKIALSQSGSGLKTVLLVLINLFLVPDYNLKSYLVKKKYIYAFEELENNLHPALQRRLFDYLYKYACESGNKVFITTHSHVAINLFYEKEKTNLYHIVKNEDSRIKRIDNFIDKVDILDDLDVKASDLFQTNGIIWVEGPSDRVYINRWLEVFCHSKYKEGVDYQFLYYGGRLLAHYNASDTCVDDLISILKMNRNAAVVIDSDRRTSKSGINKAKTRIKKELSENDYFVWITKGKEIENYLSADAISQALHAEYTQIGQYDLFPDYIKKDDKSFATHKVRFAKDISRYISLENSKNILDLKKQVEALYREIESWNN